MIWRFSVFTHLAPHDYAVMLKLQRRYIKPGGKRVFSVFLIKGTGLKVESVNDPEEFIQHYIVCSPC